MKKQLWANLIILLIGIQYVDRFIGTKSIDENTDAFFVQRKTYDTFKVLPFYFEDCVKIKGKAVKIEFE